MSEMPSNNDIAILSVIAASALAFVYKFFRVLKSDNKADGLDNEETAFRLSLREELKTLKEENCRMTKEKLELLERAIKAESQLEHTKQKCLECRYRVDKEKKDEQTANP